MVGVYSHENYRVLFTPLVGINVYGATIDVTQDVDLTDWIKSVGSIKREVDNGNYDIGIFTFGDITLSAINHTRKFNAPDDSQSIFKFRRDRCKVEILFFDADGNSSTRFKGLINDDATRIDVEKELIKFRVLSLDSIFRQVDVPAGSVVIGDLFSTVIKKVLNVPDITTTLTYSASNINVDLDLAIDVGEVFSNITAKEALDVLLLASNSVLYVDNSDVIHVKPRTESANVFLLFGGGDMYGRDNIIKISNVNNGLQRSFSSIKVNDNTTATNAAYVTEYGFKQKTLSLDFITTVSKEQQIADRILLEFHVPKDEIEVDVLSNDVKNIDLFDLVKIDYDYRASKHPADDLISMYGQADFDESYYAITSGSFKIRPKEKWKVTSIKEEPKNMVTRLRLRRAGKETHDGYFTGEELQVASELDFSNPNNSQNLTFF